jgi:CheY-like chemotaxis protein
VANDGLAESGDPLTGAGHDRLSQIPSLPVKSVLECPTAVTGIAPAPSEIRRCSAQNRSATRTTTWRRMCIPREKQMGGAMASSTAAEDTRGDGTNEAARRALLIKGEAQAGPYQVLQLSQQAVWLAGDIPFGIGERVTVVFIAGQPDQRVEADVARVELGDGHARCQLMLRDVPDEIRVSLASMAPASDSAAPSPRDRRRFRRFSIPSSAVVLTGLRYVGTYVTRNLSVGGALLVGDSNRAVGQRVRLLLQVVGQFSQTLEAEVVRREQLPSGEQSFAVSFTGQDQATGDGLRKLAALAAKQDQGKTPPQVLVLSQEPEKLAAVEGDLCSLGYEVVTVLAPLDAVSYLCSDASRVACVMVACDQDHSDGLGFLSFVREAHPTIRRVAFVHGARPDSLLPHTADGSVESVIERPWNREQLSQALHPLES